MLLTFSCPRIPARKLNKRRIGLYFLFQTTTTAFIPKLFDSSKCSLELPLVHYFNSRVKMICHSNRSNPLTGHRYGLSENLTAVTLRPLTGHRKRRQTDSDSLREHPLIGHRHKHTFIRQETGMNGMLTFRPSRDPHYYRNNSTRVVLSVQSVDFVESSARDVPSTETFSMRTTAMTPVITSTDNASVVTNGDENLPVAESQTSLCSHRRSPRRSLSMRSERSSLYAERSTVKALHGATSMTSDRSPNRSFGYYSRPSSVCTESSVFGTRSRWESASSEKMPTVTLLGRGRNKIADEDDDLNESVESLELVPLESARLELQQNDLAEDKDAYRKRKTTVSLTQTKAMIQSLSNRLRKSLRRSKSNLETKSKSELRDGKYSFNIVDKSAPRPLSAHMGGNFSSLYASLKSETRPSSTSALSKTSENNRCIVDFEKSVSMKSVLASNSSEKTPKRSFLKNSRSSLNASKEAIKNTYVNLVAPVKCLAKDDNHLEDIARSKENTRKSIKHANSNLESVNMQEPVIIRSTNSLDRRSRPSSRTENSTGMIERNETKSSRSKMDISGLTIKRLEDKPSGKGCDVIEAYIPQNENPSTFNGLKQHSIHDISAKTPPLLPSYRPPPMNSEPSTAKTPNSSKSNSSSSKKRNSSDLSVSSFEDNENQPRVHLPTNLKRRARVTKRPLKKRSNTESLCNGCTETTASSGTTTAEIACSDHQKNSDKTPPVKGKRSDPGSNNTSGSSTPTASNTPNGKLGTALEKRSKFMYGLERKGAHEPIPVPPPIPGTLKPEFRQSKENTSDNSASNHNISDGRISRTSSLKEKPERKTSQQGSAVTVGSSGTDMSESGSTPTPKRPASGPIKVWSRPVSTVSTVSNSSNDKCNNFEQLLKEIISKRTKQKDSEENLPAS